MRTRNRPKSGGTIDSCRRNRVRRRLVSWRSEQAATSADAGYVKYGDCARDHRFVVAWLLVVTLTGCGSGTPPGSAKPATDMLVAVNGDRITTRQFQDQFSAMRLRPQINSKSLDRKVLQYLVDEQLLAQKAMADKLDEDPSVIRAVDRARRKILAQAAIDHAVGEIEIGMDEARKFYADNPNLFEKRKIYFFRQFILDTARLDEPLRRKLELAKAQAEVAAALAEAKIKFSYQNEVQAAETLPREILEQAARMSSGDILVRQHGHQLALMQLGNEVLEPIDIEKAMPAIRMYLASDRRRDRTESLLKDLYRTASIKYADGLSGGPGDIAGEPAANPLSTAIASGKESSAGKPELNFRN